MPRFDQVDVFASDSFSGNPLAVVHDAADVTTETMHRITAWTNLSEATFLVPPTDPTADYRVRIFCPGRELPFAGHPTLGTAAAWLAAGGNPRAEEIVQECGVGLVRIRRSDGRLAFAAPPMQRFGPVDDADLRPRLEQLGLSDDAVVDASWIDNGPGWLGILLRSAADVLAVELPTDSLPGFDVGLLGPHRDGDDCALEVRGLFADARGQVREDPVTGSLNASAAQWLIGTGQLPDRYVAAQGTAIGRAGRVHVERVGDDVWIGGEVHTRVHGSIELD